jgi:DNA-binding CsgD family transcriptional regulator
LEYRSTELTTLARVGVGRCQIYAGDIAGGIALLDEAMVSVMAQDVSPIAVGDIYCTVIDACHELFDVRRVTDWTAVLSDWCDAHPNLMLYRGQCLLHRAEVLQLRGHWDDALDEARRVCDLREAPPAVVGSARARIGDLECLRGRFAESEAAYREASELGVDPNPGLALLRLAQGQIEIALATIRRALDQADDPIARARTLGPAVEILLSAADVDGARSAADELREVADALDALYLGALAAQAFGRVAFAAGDTRVALTELRRAADAWRDLEVPYEAARARTFLAQVYRAVGDSEGARWELESARAAFERLTAPLDVECVERLLGSQPVADRGLSAREREVLTFVAQGATNRAIASELFISERTVESHVRRIFQKLGVTTRAAATAAAYERGLRGVSGTTD